MTCGPSDTKSVIVFQGLFLVVGWWGCGKELNLMVFVALPGSEKIPRIFSWYFKLLRDNTKSWLGSEMNPAEGARIQLESGESSRSWAIFASLHVLTSASFIIRRNESQLT